MDDRTLHVVCHVEFALSAPADVQMPELTRRRSVSQHNHINALCLFPGGDLFPSSLELLDVFQLIHVGIQDTLERGAGSTNEARISDRLDAREWRTHGVPLVGLTLLNSFSTLMGV